MNYDNHSSGLLISSDLQSQDSRDNEKLKEMKQLLEETQEKLLAMEQQLATEKREHVITRNQLLVMQEKLLTARMDSLTNVPARGLVDEKLEEINNNNGYYIVAMCDIDNFKQINDTYGHLIGDKVLQLVASEFRRQIPSDTFIGRYGGDEFILFFNTVDLISVVSVISNIKNSITIKSMNIAPDKNMKITISAGLSLLIPQVELVEEKVNFVEKADRALFKSKEAEKNSITYYDCLGSGEFIPGDEILDKQYLSPYQKIINTQVSNFK